MSRVPSYRHHKARGLAVVTLSGKDIYLGPYNSPESRALYDRLIAEWLAAGRHVRPPVDRDLTVAEVLAAYIKYADSYYRHPDGRQTKQFDRVVRAVKPLAALYGPTPAVRFGPLALKAVRQEMIRLDWCRKYINSCVGCIKRAFAWAVSEELIPAAVAEGHRTVTGLRKGRSEAREKPPVPPAPEADVETAKRHVLPVVRDMIDVQLLAAMRPGEVTTMHAARIVRGGDVWRYELGENHKTGWRGTDRLILLGPRAQTILAPYLLRRPDGYLFSPLEAMEARASELGRAMRRGKSRKPGDHYRTDSYGQAIRKGCERAGIPVWSPHQLRHNAATRLVEQFGWDVARIILGHKDVNATRIYAADDLAKALAAVRQVG